MVLTIHGVPLSQPVRAVVWPCLIKKVPFKFSLAVPGMSKGPGTAAPKFRTKFPLGTVPSMEDGDVCLAEAPAILAYLSRKFQWNDYYPEDITRRARIDEYMHWHHSNTRAIAKPYFAAAVRPDIKMSAEAIEEEKGKAARSLETIENVFLGGGEGGGGAYFFGSSSGPSLADFVGYEEVAQVSGAFGQTLDLSPYPKTEQWLGTMRALPFHDEVHTALAALGPLDLTGGSTVKKLSGATKAGLAAIAEAQKAS